MYMYMYMCVDMCMYVYCVCVCIMLVVYNNTGYRERNPYIEAVNELSALILKRIL